MPKNLLTDPITDQEIAFARLVLSGTMDDRRAAEAVGLNPSTAAYTKSKPRVRAYMLEHRAAVSEKLVDQQAPGLRDLSLSRDQILARLWQLANLNPEQTRGSIAGQIKALSMIVAIEGLIPSRLTGRGLSPVEAQPADPSARPQIYVAEPLRRRQQQQADAAKAGDPAIVEEVHPAASQVSELEPPREQNQAPPPHPGGSHPEALDRVPAAAAGYYDAVANPVGPLKLPISPQRGLFRRDRPNR